MELREFDSVVGYGVVADACIYKIHCLEKAHRKIEI